MEGGEERSASSSSVRVQSSSEKALEALFVNAFGEISNLQNCIQIFLKKHTQAQKLKHIVEHTPSLIF